MKKIEIEVEEPGTRYKTYTGEVEDDVDENMVASAVKDDIRRAYHPDDVLQAFEDAGYSAELTCIGAVDAEYEVNW